MSSSVFKDYPCSSSLATTATSNIVTDTTSSGDQPLVVGGGLTKCDNNLVVFINKNGNVSMDQTALQDLLGEYIFDSFEKQI